MRGLWFLLGAILGTITVGSWAGGLPKKGKAPLPFLQHPVAVIGHRGGKALAPENTLAAFRHAIALGLDYVEIDVRTTKDGKFVLMHDRTVDRTTDGQGAVADLDFATLRSLDAGKKFAPAYAGESVPTFEEALALCRDKIHIYLDHKEAPTDQLFALVKQYGMERQVIVYNSPEELMEWKRVAPHLPVMPSLPKEMRRPGGVKEFLKRYPVEVLDGNLAEWTPQLVKEAHAAGAKVYVDNLGLNDNPTGFRKALAMGVDGIQTDYPDRLLEVLREERKPRRGQRMNRFGRQFLSFSQFEAFKRTSDGEKQQAILTSPELPCEIPAKEVVVSWNADAGEGTGLKIEARARCGDHWTKWYLLGLWSRFPEKFPRESVKGQQDADGDVATDTLVLKQPAQKVQLRITQQGISDGLPQLRFVGISLADTTATLPLWEPNRAAWGKEFVVPGKPQSGWPGASGWCSPTSTAMALAFWGEKLQRPELDVAVPDAARATFDRVYEGTGNWPFNTAFAGSFPGIRAYVTRFADLRQLEDWIVAGIPVVVSLSYDLLKGQERDNDPGHLMVCVGFTAQGDLVLNDPAYHPDRGEVSRSVYPRERFRTAWKRSEFTVYLLYPTDAKLPADPFGHWAIPTEKTEG